MIVFRLTIVCTPNGRVVWQQNFIMIGRTDGIDAADALSASCFEQFLQRLGDQALAAGGAVVGGDDVLVADRGQPVGPEQQLLGAGPLDA